VIVEFTIAIIGDWAGTATFTDDTGSQTLPVSATVTQTGTFITATVIFTNPGEIPEVNTKSGQLNGLKFSIGTTKTSGGDEVNASGTFSSNGLIMSGNGEDLTEQTTGNGGLVVSADRNHMSGNVTTSAGETLSWSLNRQ
jgi:hypothetical protein